LKQDQLAESTSRYLMVTNKYALTIRTPPDPLIKLCYLTR